MAGTTSATEHDGTPAGPIPRPYAPRTPEQARRVTRHATARPPKPQQTRAGSSVGQAQGDGDRQEDDDRLEDQDACARARMPTSLAGQTTGAEPRSRRTGLADDHDRPGDQDAGGAELGSGLLGQRDRARPARPAAADDLDAVDAEDVGGDGAEVIGIQRPGRGWTG